MPTFLPTISWALRIGVSRKACGCSARRPRSSRQALRHRQHQRRARRDLAESKRPDATTATPSCGAAGLDPNSILPARSSPASWRRPRRSGCRRSASRAHVDLGRRPLRRSTTVAVPSRPPAAEAAAATSRFRTFVITISLRRVCGHSWNPGRSRNNSFTPKQLGETQPCPSLRPGAAAVRQVNRCRADAGDRAQSGSRPLPGASDAGRS
jgi:hypothetical protein